MIAMAADRLPAAEWIVADMRRLDETAADHAADAAIEDRWIARRGVAA